MDYISVANPESMLAIGSISYADFGVSGIWMWNGTVWSQISTVNPEIIVATEVVPS